MRSGVSDYVTKPFTPHELNDAVIRVLEKAGRIPAAARA
jgi:DNA-binding response OmpR family regulator